MEKRDNILVVKDVCKYFPGVVALDHVSLEIPRGVVYGIVGENGAVIQFGVDLPPEKFYMLPYSEEARQSLSFLKNKISKLLPDIWFQPNLTGVTPFPSNEKEFDIIEQCLEQEKSHIKDIEL